MLLLVIVSKPAARNLKTRAFCPSAVLAIWESKRLKQKLYRHVQQVAAAASACAAIEPLSSPLSVAIQLEAPLPSYEVKQCDGSCTLQPLETTVVVLPNFNAYTYTFRACV